MLSRNFTDVGQNSAGLLGEAKRIRAPVVCAALADDQAKRLHLINDVHQAAGMHTKPRSQFPLAEAGGMAEHAQDSGMRGA